MCYSDSSIVANVHNTSKAASNVIHQQLFRLIAINNKMRKNRRGHDDWNEG